MSKQALASVGGVELIKSDLLKGYMFIFKGFPSLLDGWPSSPVAFLIYAWQDKSWNLLICCPSYQFSNYGWSLLDSCYSPSFQYLLELNERCWRLFFGLPQTALLPEFDCSMHTLAIFLLIINIQLHQ